MKLFLPIIAYGGQVYAEYMMSMLQLVQAIQHKKYTCTLHPIVSESLISRGRNSAAAFFLQSDCDYMLFVDTDMTFTPDDFNEVAKINKPLTIGAYCKKYIRKSKLEDYAKRNSQFSNDWESYVTDFSTEIPLGAKTEKNIKVNYDYRKEQLWGEKLQTSTEILLQNEQLQKDVIIAKSKINTSS